MTTVASALEIDGAATPVVPGAQASGVLGEAARYFVASLAALAVDAGLLWVGARGLGLAPWLAGAASYFVGLVFIYVVSVRWVFAARTLRDAKHEFAAFALLGVLGLVLNSLVLHVATAAGLALPFAKALSAGIGFVANFATRKVLLFTSARTRQAARS